MGKGVRLQPYLIPALLGSLLAIAPARAGSLPPLVTFDFDDLGRFDRARQITDYMTDIYGSSVTVDDAISIQDEDASDMFIGTSFQIFNRGDFIITFDDVPILGAAFEGHIIDASREDDFVFRALDGDTERLVFSLDEGEQVFLSGWLDFGGPVDTLIISDSGRKDVGIDDLVVQPVPEPATGLLLLAGLAAAWRRRSRRVAGR